MFSQSHQQDHIAPTESASITPASHSSREVQGSSLSDLWFMNLRRVNKKRCRPPAGVSPPVTEYALYLTARPLPHSSLNYQLRCPQRPAFPRDRQSTSPPLPPPPPSPRSTPPTHEPELP